MKLLPKISVVTITYGHEHYITQMIDGILMQEYAGEIEFIIANDHSPDDTDIIIIKYLKEKNIPTNFTIKYTTHSSNKGVMPNFMFALGQATGKYIALCEGDDYWIDSLKLRKQFDLLENNPDISMCFTSRITVDEDGNILSESKIAKKKWSTKEIALGYVPPTQTIFSKNYAEEFLKFMKEHPYSYGGDKIYSYFHSLQGNIISMPEITAAYRVHSGGVWSRYNLFEKNKLQIEQSLLFFKEISKNDLEEDQLREDFFRKIISQKLFLFWSEPISSVKQMSYILTKHKVRTKFFLTSISHYLIYSCKHHIKKIIN